MTSAEHSLLIYRLRELAEAHDKAEDEDDSADCANTLETARAREGLIDANLLRQAVAALGAA